MRSFGKKQAYYVPKIKTMRLRRTSSLLKEGIRRQKVIHQKKVRRKDQLL
jgi:hypothetical protein